MAYTQDDLDRIKKAIANGTQSVEIDGKKVVYRTLAEMKEARAEIEGELSQSSGSTVIRQTFASFSRG